MPQAGDHLNTEEKVLLYLGSNLQTIIAFIFPLKKKEKKKRKAN